MIWGLFRYLVHGAAIGDGECSCRIWLWWTEVGFLVPVCNVFKLRSFDLSPEAAFMNV
jgi:hypothetical protein